MKSAAVKMSQALSNYHFLKHGTDTNAARGLIIDIEDNLKCPNKKRRTLTNASWVSRECVKALNWDAASPDIHSWFNLRHSNMQTEKLKTQRGNSYRLL